MLTVISTTVYLIFVILMGINMIKLIKSYRKNPSEIENIQIEKQNNKKRIKLLVVFWTESW